MAPLSPMLRGLAVLGTALVLAGLAFGGYGASLYHQRAGDCDFAEDACRDLQHGRVGAAAYAMLIGFYITLAGGLAWILRAVVVRAPPENPIRDP